MGGTPGGTRGPDGRARALRHPRPSEVPKRWEGTEDARRPAGAAGADRRAVTTDATHAETTWELERQRSGSGSTRSPRRSRSSAAQSPEVELIVELADRLARMEGRTRDGRRPRCAGGDLDGELAALEARVDEGLATLESQGAAGVIEPWPAPMPGCPRASSSSPRIETIERDRDAVRAELARTAHPGRPSGPVPGARLRARRADRDRPGACLHLMPDESTGPSPQELDGLRIGVEGLRMRLAYHEKTVSDLAGSRGVVHGSRAERAHRSARCDRRSRSGPGGNDRAGKDPTLRLPHARRSGLLSRSTRPTGTARERERMLDQMEKIASRMDWRLQRLEAEGAGVTVNSN